MSTDDLDRSIDAVAKQMVDVRDDAEFATRIASALPERRSRLFWLIPQLGAAAAIVMTAVVWFNREAPAPQEAILALVPLRAPLDAVEPFRPVEPVARIEPVRTKPLEPLAPLEPLEPLDHERALPAVPAPAVLALSDLAPRELPEVGALTLEPLEIGELPLTGESFPPREY